MPSKSDQDSLTSILTFQFPMIVVTALVVGVAVWILDWSIGRNLEANRVALETSAATINIALEENHAALLDLNADVAKSFDRLEQVIRSESESLRTKIDADRRAADAQKREIRKLVAKLGTVQTVQEE